MIYLECKNICPSTNVFNKWSHTYMQCETRNDKQFDIWQQRIVQGQIFIGRTSRSVCCWRRLLLHCDFFLHDLYRRQHRHVPICSPLWGENLNWNNSVTKTFTNDKFHSPWSAESYSCQMFVSVILRCPQTVYALTFISSFRKRLWQSALEQWHIYRRLLGWSKVTTLLENAK